MSPRSILSASEGGPHGADVVVVGAGLIGLAISVGLADRGLRVIVIGEPRAGEASRAAAGMLAPSVERVPRIAQRFAERARDRYPEFLAWLEAARGVRVPLNRRGILQLAMTEEQAEPLRRSMIDSAQWLDPADVASLESALTPVAGAVHHAHDGAVDNVALLDALGTFVTANQRIELVTDAVIAIELRHDKAVTLTRRGARIAGSTVVLAAGAWAASIAGTPRTIPIEPVRGQMLALEASPLAHVVYSAAGYLVPRGKHMLIGSTMEHVGFDASTTVSAAERLRETAVSVVPRLTGAASGSTWAGLRPMTPDGLPIIGRDPQYPALVYACGHSRNGVLMAPLTADCVVAVITGGRPPADLAPFAVERFSRSAASGQKPGDSNRKAAE